MRWKSQTLASLNTKHSMEHKNTTKFRNEVFMKEHLSFFQSQSITCESNAQDSSWEAFPHYSRRSENRPHRFVFSHSCKTVKKYFRCRYCTVKKMSENDTPFSRPMLLCSTRHLILTNPFLSSVVCRTVLTSALSIGVT